MCVGWGRTLVSSRLTRLRSVGYRVRRRLTKWGHISWILRGSWRMAGRGRITASSPFSTTMWWCSHEPHNPRLVHHRLTHRPPHHRHDSPSVWHHHLSRLAGRRHARPGGGGGEYTILALFR